MKDLQDYLESRVQARSYDRTIDSIMRAFDASLENSSETLKDISTILIQKLPTGSVRITVRSTKRLTVQLDNEVPPA